MAENEQLTFRESLDTALEVMAEDPYLRILLKRVPLFGDSLVEIAAGKGQQIAQERRDEFLELLAERLADLEGLAVRTDYFETPEGFDMLVKALDESRKTRSREKRKLYARILKGAILDFERREFSSEEYLNLLSDLTERDLTIARAIYEERPKSFEGQSRSDEWDAWQEKTRGEIGVDAADLQLALRRLHTLGLLEAITAGEDGDSIVLIGPEPNLVMPYEVSPSFEKLMRFLQLSG